MRMVLVLVTMRGGRTGVVRVPVIMGVAMVAVEGETHNLGCCLEGVCWVGIPKWRRAQHHRKGDDQAKAIQKCRSRYHAGKGTEVSSTG